MATSVHLYKEQLPMKQSFILSTAFIFLLSVSECLGQEKEKIALLLDRAPARANSICYLNVPALNKLMDEAGFSQQISTSVQEVWFIADLDFAELRPKWEAGYAMLKKPLTADRIAASVGGYIDSVEGQNVVHAPKLTYFVPATANPERLGILRPTDRRLLAGWISPGPNWMYSEFLSSQASQPEAYLSFMLAVDLKNVLSPVPLASRIENLESLKSKPAESVAKILASIEGFTVIVGRQSLQQCIVKFQFASSPASLRPIAPELLAEILERSGNDAAEVKTWKVNVEENVLSLQGPITQSTLSGLLGIFSMQSQAERVANHATADETSKEKQVAYQSKYYFSEVTAIIERTRDHKSQTTGAMANWNDKRARQIDELATLNIDPEMVQYGSDVAELLRGNALTVRQGNIDAGKVKANQALDSGYYDGGYGYYNANSIMDYQRVTDSMARGNAAGSYRETLKIIDQLTAETRRNMTEKFQIQF